MTAEIKRRAFITMLGGAAAVWPFVAGAQQPAVPVVGFLNAGSPGPLRRQVAAFHQGLNEAGYVEGQNVAVDYRFAEGQYDRLKALADDLVSRQVSVIAAFTNAGALAGASSPALTGRAETRPASINCRAALRQSGWDCSTTWFRMPTLSLPLSIPTNPVGK
jgi:hypothetical protein